MDTSLETPSFPVAIADGFIEKEETSIVMQCHDRVFQRVTVLDEAGEKLFTAASKGIASWSWRRTVKDASGSPLYDLRKTVGNAIRSRWVVEGLSGQEICSLRHVSFRRRQALDVVFRNDNDKGNEKMVEVRPKDQGALTTLVNIKGALVAEIQMTEVNTSLNGLDRSVWRARVASKVDLALVSTNVLLYI
jgi:LURP-one-related